MAKALHQITFEFLNEEANVPKEFLSGKPLNAGTKKAKSTRGRKSTKETDIEQELIEIPEDEVLYKKQYYPIGEVAGMFKTTISQLRYWENEFDILQPRKNRKGDRFFKPADIKNLQLIYDLVRRRKFTIEGAKDYIKKNKKAGEKQDQIESLQKIKTFLLQIKSDL